MPADIKAARNRVFFIHKPDWAEVASVSEAAGDQLFSVTGGSGTAEPASGTVLLNGQVSPVISDMQADTWEKWRIIYGGWLSGYLELSISGCEWYVSAKDGVYVKDHPRALRGPLNLAPGNRVDVMVRCAADGSGGTVTVTTVDGGGDLVDSGGGGGDAGATQSLTLVTLDAPKSAPTPGSMYFNAYQATSGPPTAWNGLADPERPYLMDRISTPTTDGCSGDYQFDGNNVNGDLYSETSYLHTTFVDAVVERHLFGADAHPYHQHVFPFQIWGSFSDATGYYMQGDFHDTWMFVDCPGDNSWYRWQWFTSLGGNTDDVDSGSPCKIKYKIVNDIFADEHIMIHCHRLQHEDMGMMSQEHVLGSGGECSSSRVLNYAEVVLLVSLCLIPILVGIVVCIYIRRRKGWANCPGWLCWCACACCASCQKCSDPDEPVCACCNVGKRCNQCCCLCPAGQACRKLCFKKKEGDTNETQRVELNGEKIGVELG